MPIITFIRSDNRSESIEARIGDSAMLAATRHGVDEIVAENSRLSCQIKIEQELDGLVLRLPERQL